MCQMDEPSKRAGYLDLGPPAFLFLLPRSPHSLARTFQISGTSATALIHAFSNRRKIKERYPKTQVGSQKSVASPGMARKTIIYTGSISQPGVKRPCHAIAEAPSKLLLYVLEEIVA